VGQYLVDSTLYEVRFDDDAVEELESKGIADTIYAKIDGEGFERMEIDAINEHCYVGGIDVPQSTSLVRWKDDTEC